MIFAYNYHIIKTKQKEGEAVSWNDSANLAKAKAIERRNKERLLKVNPILNDGSGIYFLTRDGEDGLKYAYIGQAKHIATRLAQHLSGYDQHIDRSLKKHGLYSKDNVNGWKVGFLNFPEDKLDDREQYYIREYAAAGYQLRNKTAGSQGEGKTQIDEYRPAKGYRDGIRQGKITLARELSQIIDKHLVVTFQPGKENNKVSIRAMEKFKSLIDEKSYKE